MPKYNPTALELLEKRARVDEDAAAYLKRLKVSKCPDCGSEHWTVDGKVMRCGPCGGRRTVLDQPSIALETAKRVERKRKREGRRDGS